MVNNGRHIPWYVKAPKSFGAKKFALLCRISKELFGNTIMLKINSTRCNHFIPKAKEFNNRGFSHRSVLSLMRQYYDLSSDRTTAIFFSNLNNKYYLPSYYYNEDDNREKMICEQCRKIFHKYDALLSWSEIMRMSKANLRNIINSFKTEMAESLVIH